MSSILANGQVAASATTIYTAVGPSALGIVLHNTSASTTETVVVTVLPAGGTARRVARAVLAPNESVVIRGIQVAADDLIKATTTNATTVDYLLNGSPGQFEIIAYDANGTRKSNNAGQDTTAIGANTIALGTNSGTAAALPAGTALVYPTTAADDTVGVIINAADQVTGRKLFIGNGVSAKILKVYAPTGGTINGAAANAAFSSASGKGVIIVCLSSASNTWLAW